MRVGTVIAGLRVEEELGRGPHGSLYVATQLSLGRTVELELLDEVEPELASRLQRGAQLQAALHHPHVLSVYDAGRTEHGPFVARRLVRGRTLADVRGRRAVRQLLEQAAEALDAAHAAGLAHGRLSAESVLVDETGRALLDRFGVAGSERGVAGDRRALAQLVRDRLGQAVPDADGLNARDMVSAAGARGRRRGRLLAAIGAAAVAVLGVVTALVLAGGDARDLAARPAPPAAPGASPLGSALSGGAAEPVDCTGRAPSLNSPACTLVQTHLGGRALTVPAAGVIRRWAVRGATGALALQVVRRRAKGGYAEVRRSQYKRPADRGPHAFAAGVPVRRGDLVGVELTPGAGIGARPTRRARALSWVGPLEIIRAPRPPSRTLRAAPGELMLRVDIARGARPRSSTRALGGAAARAAPSGRQLDAEEVELRGGAVARVELVRLRGRLAVDLLRGRRRLARVPVPDADPRGRFVDFEQGFVSNHQLRLRWLNPGGSPQVIHDYAVAATTLRLIN